VTIETPTDCSNLSVIGDRLQADNKLNRQLNTDNVNVNCVIGGEYVSCL
jgi:hypothetical protein